MSLFPHITNFFIDCMDKCMSDVHCPICLVLSPRNFIESERNFAQNVNDVSSNEYMIKNQISTKWNHDYSEQYTSSFELEDIIDIQAQINKVIVNSAHTSLYTIDALYNGIKDLFLKPAQITGMCKNRTFKKTLKKKGRRHGHNVWFNKYCERLRREYISVKNSLQSI